MGSMERKDAILNLAEINESINLDRSDSLGEFAMIGAPEEIQDDCRDLVALNVANSFDALTFESVAKEGLSDTHLDFVVDKILSALLDIAHIPSKGSSYIEPNEINQVKKVLDEEICSPECKAEISKELTEFQEKIIAKYKDSINQYYQMMIELDVELDKLERQKSLIISKRLSQFMWPFNSVTREIDFKIKSVRRKIQTCDSRMEAVEAMRPAAKECDIRIFERHLKEKFKNCK